METFDLKTLIFLAILSVNSFAESANMSGRCNLASGWYKSYQEGRRSMYVNCQEIDGKQYQLFWTPSYTDRESSFGCTGPVRFYGATICKGSKCDFADSSGDYVKTTGAFSFEVNADSLISYYRKSINPFCESNPEVGN